MMQSMILGCLAIILSGVTSLPAQAQSRFWMTPRVPEWSREDIPKSTKRGGLERAPLMMEEAMRSSLKVLTFRMPKDFEYEFSLLVVNGKIKRAFIVSTALAGQHPIVGVFRLSVPELKGKPWPWRTSIKYQNSPMYWGLQINGGYFIHSSPHYGNLGRPASMGCLRASIPDAMEVFDWVVNRNRGSNAFQFIYENTSLDSKDAGAVHLLRVLSDSQWTVQDLQNALKRSRLEVEAVSKGDLEFSGGVPVDAHLRPLIRNEERYSPFPLCLGVDCWDYFNKTHTTLRLKPWVQFENPVLQAFHSEQAPIPIQAGSQIPLDDLLDGALQGRDPFLIHEVRIEAESLMEGLEIRICETETEVCSKVRTIEPGTSGFLVYPLYQISQKFKTSSGLRLEGVSGSGLLQDLKVDFFGNTLEKQADQF